MHALSSPADQTTDRTSDVVTRATLIFIARATAALAAVFAICGCEREPGPPADDHNHAAESSATGPTNRIDIPASVRQNLGITFVKVEPRSVSQTLRVPGRFEFLPTARREYRTPLGGRVELLVAQFQSIEPGTPLYRVDSAAWRDLHEQISISQARVESMTPLREAHRRHEQSLADKVALWQARADQLGELREAGGGSAALFTEARAALNATQAELADVMEKDAELNAQQKQAEAELRALISRRHMLLESGKCGITPADAGGSRVNTTDASSGYTVCAVAAGIVETIGITPGGLAEEHGHIVTVVQPDQIRFRARGLQSDLGRLRDGLAARIAPPQGGTLLLQDTMTGVLQLGLAADADERTVDLIVQPASLAPWARAGVSAHLEITLSSGSTTSNPEHAAASPPTAAPVELAIPISAVIRDGATPIIFRRDPSNPDQAIRMEADLGISDGRWIVIHSGVKEGDEIVLAGNYQLMLATSGAAAKGGHFHPDGTFHEGDH